MSLALAVRPSPSADLARPAEAEAEDLATRRDHELVSRFRRGERRAFDELVRLYQRPIYFLAYRYVRNPDAAAELAQRSFVAAFASLARFRAEASFRAWLYRIAINLSLNHLRDRRRESLGEVPEAALVTEPVGAGRFVSAEQRAALRRAIDALAPKQRLVVELRIYDELSFREVAELARCSENSAKVSFHHALTRLRAILTEEEP